jgi:hypothetical protein
MSVGYVRPLAGFQGECRKGGNSRWSSRTKYSNVWTAAPISFSPLANNSSSTINNSRTNPNAARTARASELKHWDYRKMAETTSGWKQKPCAPVASGKPLCRSSPRKDVRCFAASASSNARPQLLQLEGFRRRERGIAEAFCQNPAGIDRRNSIIRPSS